MYIPKTNRKKITENLVGRRFTRLTVISQTFNPVICQCICDCGKKHEVYGSRLLAGIRKSCGCYQRDRQKEVTSKRMTTHGDHKAKLYKVWNAMRERCNNPKTLKYSRYGGRGIKVCDEWNNYVPFRDWSLKNGYKEGLQIDRENNDGDYTPANCRWVTRKENMSNTSRNVWIEINGETKTITQWAEEIGIYSKLVWSRMRFGWSTIEALTTPINGYRKKNGELNFHRTNTRKTKDAKN